MELSSPASLGCVLLVLQGLNRLCFGLALPFQNPIKTLHYQLLQISASVSLLACFPKEPQIDSIVWSK